MNEDSVKSKFQNSSKILDNIPNNQRTPDNKIGLGYNKEEKPECSSHIQKGKSYAAALMSSTKRDENKKSTYLSHKP